MINSIIQAISVALYSEFEYENHMEEIVQGLEAPCFFISCLNPTVELFLGQRYFRQNQFCIQYFPATESKQDECNSVAERMMWTLEYITVANDQYRSSKVRYEIIDGVLNFFLNFDCFVYKVTSSDNMDTMALTNTAK